MQKQEVNTTTSATSKARYSTPTRYQMLTGGTGLGSTDYIFGAASAWFQNCTVASVEAGFITANGREKADDTWYVFDKCKIVAAAGKSLKEKVYLGRPWRKLSRVMYQNSMLSDIVHPEGWSRMAEGAIPLFYEHGNSGAGSNTAHRKTESRDIGAVAIGTVLKEHGWIDPKF
jgi:pectinesterase